MRCHVMKSFSEALYIGYPLADTLANSKDPDEIQYIAAFHHGLYCFPGLKQT